MKKFFHVKRGDIVVVISGAHKGKSGKILEMLMQKNRARVEGVAMIKKHEKKSEKNPQGAITEREGTVHVSNLMLKSLYDASPRRQAGLATKASAAPKS
ncbi:MAG: 50S ribosomal protein L24 [Opitutaceae bacterium]|nr:50S ribosomal protein L24 [Opitutaceae bacterium]